MDNRVVHFEIPSDDPEKAMKFFEAAFNWSFSQFGKEQYWLVTTGSDNCPGINGGLMKKKDPRQPLVNTIDVENLDESIEKIEKAGGKIVMPRMAIPTVGWVAYFTDPDGNIHGVYEPDADAR